VAQQRPIIEGNSQKCIYVYRHKENTPEYEACLKNLAKFDSLNPTTDTAIVPTVTGTDTTERNWAGLDANQREAMRNLSQYFFEQAAKEQAQQNDFVRQTIEAQQRKYEDDKIREQMRSCFDNQLKQNPYNPNSSACY
jgi:hypothetical protein